MGESCSRCMLFVNASRGQDPRSQMKHKAAWRQRNHSCPGLASFQRCNDRRCYCHVKDRLGMYEKGRCLVQLFLLLWDRLLLKWDGSMWHELLVMSGQEIVKGIYRQQKGMSEAQYSLNILSPLTHQMRKTSLLLQTIGTIFRQDLW